ncbi:hypothetical protein EK21DRAFT_53859 [Setomelanomma holmii]|uniref:Uncharacterized protein n=1 Tax=Setomelanomma holmii TaxID=210430 RepID=A0A9P4HHQ7_9PLEO|nr:hypothetical protein EK21DRAFT_53859 [Setomelanomma holmii]
MKDRPDHGNPDAPDIEGCTVNRRRFSRILESVEYLKRAGHKPSRRFEPASSPHVAQASFDLSSSTERILGENSSRSAMTTGLLRIYHDSLENALSCWLTEHNCPYSLRKIVPPMREAHNALQEWGSSWSNRMYNRVVDLDRAYATVRTRTLTADEDRAVSKALNMSVVAFASQWAQAGERSTTRPANSAYSTNEFPQSNPFERSMQESLWHQTSQLLHQAAAIDSFRVVFALIIFSLVQQPLDMARPAPNTNSSSMSYERFQAIVQDEETPLFLEIALRQILAQRRKLERMEHENAQRKDNSRLDPLREEDRATFNLLYWLGVMFDTLSAAICQRAVVVDDDDCELPQPDHFAVLGADQDEVWGDLFIRSGIVQSDPEATRWPCSYNLAASTLSSAAPVKVLLFRRVGHLQALLSRKASAVKIESAVKSAFHVYNHWHRRYNPFMLDCVKRHHELPTRIQSWYVLLAGHWHLATFLLSDLLEIIDSTRLSLPGERASRRASNLVTTLRRQNALSVADLSRSSIYSCLGEAQDFHFALNEAALLTEPWTVIFVRSLCRAGYILAEIATKHPDDGERRHARQRCSDCVDGLWYLGRKSDMAFLAARALSQMINEERAVTNVPSGESLAEDCNILETEACQNGLGKDRPGDAVLMDCYAEPMNLFQTWSTSEERGGSTFSSWMFDSESFSMDTNFGIESAPIVDVAL